MKRLLPFAPLLLLTALLLSPAAALGGAREGLHIWWDRVLPALLPSMLCIRLAQGLGLLNATARHPRGQLLAVVGFSLVSGAPNGARLLHALWDEGSISAKESKELLPFVNSVSPAFLLSIIASEPLKHKALFLPMGLAFYGCILCMIAPLLFHGKTDSRPHKPVIAILPFPKALASAIEGCMLDMLKIGGSIVLVCTLLSVTRPLTPGAYGRAALAGLLEVSTGTSAVAELPVPLRLKTSLLAGVSSFGGLSLMLQTMCCYPELQAGRYLLKKLMLGVMTGLCCYLLFPLFPNVSAAFAGRQEVLSRSLSLCALALSSTLSMAFIFVLSLMMSSRKKG